MASKKVQGFSNGRKILMLFLSVLFHLQNLVSVFGILIFSQDIWGNIHYVPKINLISDKSLLSPEQNKLKKSETRFYRRNTAEDNNAKINVSLNIPQTFLLFKAIVFLQIFIPRNLIFRQVLRTSIFLSSKCLAFVYLFFY